MEIRDIINTIRDKMISRSQYTDSLYDPPELILGPVTDSMFSDQSAESLTMQDLQRAKAQLSVQPPKWTPIPPKIIASCYSSYVVANYYPGPPPMSTDIDWRFPNEQVTKLEQQLAESEDERMNLAMLWGKEREENARLRDRITELETKLSPPTR